MNKLFTVLIIMVSVTLYAQEPRQWQKRYNGSANGDDYAKSLAIDIYGNIYVCGTSIGSGTSRDFLTIKYNQFGDTLWVRRYNGGSDYANGISVDQLCNVYVTGETSEGVTTVKYDSSGNFEWKRAYNVMNSAIAEGVAVSNDNSGNVFVFGTLFGFIDTSGYITIKYDPEGNTKWIRRYGSNEGFATAMVIDISGNIIVTGFTYVTNDDFTTIKYNNNGDSLWVRTYNTPGYYDHPTSIAIDSLGNVFVTGEGGGSPFVYWLYKYLTLKYDANGNLLWERRYDGLGNDRDFAFAVCADNYGNVYVTGESSGPGSNFDYATIKYNSLGDSLWVRRYNGPGNNEDRASSMCLDSEGNVYVTGLSYGQRTQRDFATIKYNSSGTLKWVMRYDGPVNGNDEGAAIKSDLTGNIYVTGTSRGISTGYDFLTIKYSSLLTEINNFTQNNYKEYHLFQNYPNPFNPVTKISFEIPIGALTKLKVYDILGNEIMTLIDGYKQSGNYTEDFNGMELSSGIYFYELTTGDFTAVKQMALIK